MTRLLGLFYRQYRAFAAVMALGFVLIFFNLSHVDLLGDNAHYAARAVGLADFMFGDSQYQSTPLQWFDRLPAWAALSWHDHPPVLFFIQHFFMAFGPGLFWAKLSYALLALATIPLVYASANIMYGRRAALLAALALVLNAHFIWFARASYMEAGVIFFVSLAWWYFLKFIADQKYWWQFGLTLGLLAEVKFTALFLWPAVLAYSVVAKRHWWRLRAWYFAWLAALAVTLPQIFYNLFMYRDTGHFGLQLARLFGQPSPWSLAGANHNLAQGLVSGLKLMVDNVSWPYALLALAGLIIILIKEKQNALYLYPIFFLMVEDALIGSKELYAPFLAVSAAVAAQALYNKLPRLAGIVLLVALGAYLAIFTVNSNWRPDITGRAGWWQGSHDPLNRGVYQFDIYLTKLFLNDPSLTKYDMYRSFKARSPGLSKYLLRATPEELAANARHASVVLFDGNINWFSRVWLFERRRFYDNLPVLSLNEQNLINQLQIDSFYFIRATDAAPLDSASFQNTAAAETESKLIAAGLAPDLIYRDDGQVAFKVYKFIKRD